MTDFKEKRLIEQLKSGDIKALESAYKNYAEKILNQSYRILLSREAAEDIVHDLFISLSRRLQTFKGESSLGTWLYRVTHNLCLEKLRQEKNRKRLLQEHGKAVDSLQEIKIEDRDLLQQAMEILDPETRSLLWLKEGEGLEVRELSQVLEIPEGTLKSRLSRGREKLRQWMEKEEKYAT
jgi:RNA polymerase sigma-70 factor (ECF subfamily)